MVVVYLLVALLGAAIAIFAVQNNSVVVVRFLGWEVGGALSLVVLLSILVGIVLTALLGAVRHWRLRSRIRQLESRLARVSVSEPAGREPGAPVSSRGPEADHVRAFERDRRTPPSGWARHFSSKIEQSGSTLQ